MAIVIYTSEHCPYRIRAKQLLEAKKARYQLIDVTNDQAQRQLLVEKSNGLRTVPQIFIKSLSNNSMAAPTQSPGCFLI